MKSIEGLGTRPVLAALLMVAQRRRVIDGGYDLRASDVTGDGETAAS